MWLAFGSIAVGLALLVWSADKFVEAATFIAKHLGVSTMIIGITVVGFGTSAPEILVSVVAVLGDTPNIAIGNALGSNIANIGLILGATALITPLPIAKVIFEREFPLLLIATGVMAWCLYDQRLSYIDGYLLLILLVLILWYMVRSHHKEAKSILDEDEQDKEHTMSFLTASAWTISGLILLVGSSKLLVWGATEIAHTLGVSELIIGLTVVALGTSLPELAASIASVKKGEPDLAIGNVIGSNLFNSLAVIGIPATFTSFSIDSLAVTRDLPVVIFLTLLCFCLSRFPTESRGLSKAKGLVLLSSFGIYQLYLYYGLMTGNP